MINASLPGVVGRQGELDLATIACQQPFEVASRPMEVVLRVVGVGHTKAPGRSRHELGKAPRSRMRDGTGLSGGLDLDESDEKRGIELMRPRHTLDETLIGRTDLWIPPRLRRGEHRQYEERTADEATANADALPRHWGRKAHTTA